MFQVLKPFLRASIGDYARLEMRTYSGTSLVTAAYYCAGGLTTRKQIGFEESGRLVR